MSSDFGFKQRQFACEMITQKFGLQVTVKETQDEIESEVMEDGDLYDNNERISE